MSDWTTWRAAMQRALYGPDGFFVRTPHTPAGHFRTSVHASELFAAALLELARSAGLSTVVDIGAGGGELLQTLHRLDPGLTLVGVEVAPRPPGLVAAIGWEPVVPQGISALVIANEWLDNVPVDVVELSPDGPRLVEVDRSGRERLGAEPDAEDGAWLRSWWPLREVGDRAEVGRPRDAAWAEVLASLSAGIAVAVDYAHTCDDRPACGSLAGYRGGRRVDPVPDGSCDLTAHVALDSCAVAGEEAGAAQTATLSQRDALHALGVRGTPPDPRAATTDPTGYLRALRDSSEAAELSAGGGLGSFTWLVQSVATELPVLLAPTPD